MKTGELAAYRIMAILSLIVLTSDPHGVAHDPNHPYLVIFQALGLLLIVPLFVWILWFAFSMAIRKEKRS